MDSDASVVVVPSIEDPQSQYNKLSALGLRYVVKPPSILLGLLNWPEARTLVIPILLLLGVGLIEFINNRKQEMLPYLFLYLISVFMAKGLNEPFSAIYVWLAGLQPVLTMTLRDPVHWLLVINMCISIFIASSVKQSIEQNLSYSINKKKLYLIFSKKSITVIITTALITLAVSQVVYSRFAIDNTRNPILPEYYSDIINYLNERFKNDTFRLYLPGWSGASHYQWSSGKFLENPILAQLYPSIVYYTLIGLGATKHEDLLLQVVRSGHGDYATSELLGLMNVKYVVIENDKIPNDWYNPLPEIQLALTLPNLKLEKSFGQIKLLANERYRTNIYAPKWIVPISSLDSVINSARIISFYNQTTSVAYIDKTVFPMVISSVKGKYLFLNASPPENQPIIVVDDRQTTFWETFAEGVGNISIVTLNDTNELVKSGVDSLKLHVGKGRFATSQIIHYFSSPQDWSIYDRISLEWYGTNSKKKIELFLYTAPLPPRGYNYYKWSFLDNFEGWRKLTFSLKSPNDQSYPSHGKPDISKIDAIGISLPEGEWYLDRITLDYGPVSSIPLQDTTIYEIDTDQLYLDITRIRYDEYKVNIKNISNSFIIILNDLYSPLWRVIFHNSDADQVQIIQFKANLYANAWIIKNPPSPSLEITILYEGRYYMLMSIGLLSFYVTTTFLVTVFDVYKKYRLRFANIYLGAIARPVNFARCIKQRLC
jgi:hypothetical protein